MSNFVFELISLVRPYLKSFEAFIFLVELSKLHAVDPFSGDIKPEKLFSYLSKALKKLRSSDKAGRLEGHFKNFEETLQILPPSYLTEIVQRIIKEGDGENSLLRLLEVEERHCPTKYHYISYDLVKFVISELQLKAGERIYLPFNASSLLIARLLQNGQQELRIEGLYSPRVLGLISDPRLEVDLGNSDFRMTQRFPEGYYSTAFSFPILSGQVDLPGMSYSLDYRKLQERELLGSIVNRASRRAIVLLPYNELTRASASVQEERRALLERGAIEAVVQFPCGLLSGTNNGICAVILRGFQEASSSSNVRMVDASPFCRQYPNRAIGGGGAAFIADVDGLKEAIHANLDSAHSKAISTEEIIAYHFNLLPSRYISAKNETSLQKYLEHFEYLGLGDLVSIIRPVAISATEDGPHEIFEASVADIDESLMLNRPRKVMRISAADYEKAKRFRLQSDDVLFSQRGNIGKVALVGLLDAEEWFPNQSFVILRISPSDSRICPEFLARYLSSPMFRASLVKFTAGTMVKVIQARELRSLPVPLPAKQEQERVRNVHNEILQKYEKIGMLKEQVRRLEGENWYEYTIGARRAPKQT